MFHGAMETKKANGWKSRIHIDKLQQTGATEETDVIKVYVHRREHIASLVICMCRVTTIGFIECDQYPPVSRRGHLPSIQLRYRGTIRTSVHQGDAPG